MADDLTNLAENLAEEVAPEENKDAETPVQDAVAAAAGGEAGAATPGQPEGGEGGDGGEGQAPGDGAPAAAQAEMKNLNLIMDIPLKVAVELGRTKMVVSELLNLGQGSVVELNKLAGEPMEVLVNDKLIARGEAVVVNEKFGIRLTDIISPMERVQQLK